VGDNFRIDRQAVVDTAAKFESLSGEYKALMGAAGFASPSTGDGEIDSVLDTGLRTVGELHLMLAQAIFQHGVKLDTAARNVSSTEDDLCQLMDQIFIGTMTIPSLSPDTPPDSSSNFDGNQGG
jgi:Family of unknown function (DUF6317)